MPFNFITSRKVPVITLGILLLLLSFASVNDHPSVEALQETRRLLPLLHLNLEHTGTTAQASGSILILLCHEESNMQLTCLMNDISNVHVDPRIVLVYCSVQL